MSMSDFRRRVRTELARARLNQRALARRLAVPDTTLSDWLCGAHPGPEDLAQRIERALGLAAGSLNRKP